MIVLKIFLEFVAYIVDILATTYTWLILAACILSFFNPNPYNRFVVIITRLTDPAFDFVRSKFNTNFNGVDLAPLIILLFLVFIQKFLIRVILAFVN